MEVLRKKACTPINSLRVLDFSEYIVRKWLLMTEKEIIESLQGNWMANDGSLSFKIENESVKNIVGVNKDESVIQLVFIQQLDKWQIVLPAFGWRHVIIQKIDKDVFSVKIYTSYTSMMNKSISNDIIRFTRVTR